MEYEEMKVFLDLPDGFYAVKGNELYKVDFPMAKFDNTKTVKITSIKIQRNPKASISEEIQHVGYDDAQCGREK